MKAYLKQYQQAPRKVRLIADAVRGMSVDRALMTLEFMPKKSARVLYKLIASALSNTDQENLESIKGADYYVKTLMVDEGPRLRRFRPGFKGSADKFYRRSSHVTVELGKHNNLTPSTKDSAKTKTTAANATATK